MLFPSIFNSIEYPSCFLSLINATITGKTSKATNLNNIIFILYIFIYQIKIYKI